MTDTTDIKALRESAESIMNLLDNLAGFEPQDIDMDAVELRFEDENGVDTGCDISIVDTAQQSADIIRALLDQLDQLEAERQQREAAESSVGVLEGIIARKEFDSLKGEQVPVAFDADIIRDANRYRFLRDEDAWGEDSDSWDVETRTGLISSENLMGGLSPDHFDAAIDARMAASDIPFFNPVMDTSTPIGFIPKGWAKRYLNGVNTGCWIYGEKSHSDDEPLFLDSGIKVVNSITLPRPYFGDRNCLDKREVIAAIEAAGGIVKDGE